MKTTKIHLPTTLNQRYFEVLLEETERRFPERVETTEDNNGHKRIYRDLEQAHRLLTFLQDNSNPKTDLFRTVVKKLVFDYEGALQNMQLNAGVWISADNPLGLLHPDGQAIRETAGQDFHYQIGKINEYLSSSDTYSAVRAVKSSLLKEKLG
ncbi:hypothetical protein R5Q29_05740 [Oenococcus oeni]|uniref:hypothetical protein n=1 Tax=Oenococcus oeni TaxID=1247 RepID=UPI00050F1905|nr:hypothetical protein [Oenococcus oeni]KGH86611.1 hypothetical protein X302_01870 [Oenococcus oeni IOEB_VF]